MKQRLNSFILGAGSNSTKQPHTTINVIGESIKRSTKVRYLGGHLDSNLTFKDHIFIKCKVAPLNIIKVCNIRKYLTRETYHKLVLYLVISHLDYANSMLAGLSLSMYKNNTKSPKHSCKTNPQKKCQGKHHRMPQNPTLATNKTKDRLQICTLIHNCHTRQAPVYLQNVIQEKTTSFSGLRLEN